MILVALALAADDRPAPATPVPGDCQAVEVLRPGPTTRTCSSLSIPPAEYADLLALEAWGEHMADVRRLESAACADDLERVAERADYWRTLAERPAPAALPPAAWLGIGVLGGVAITVGAGWALGQVAGG